jgi:hypothetical protein
MSLTGNEVSADNQQRQYGEITKSPVGDVLQPGIAIAGPAVALSASLLPTGSVGLAIAGSVVAGMGIVDWFRNLGSSKVSENLEILGQATEDALNRIENSLRLQGKSVEELRNRMDSDEFKTAMATASLQALRTTQRDRLERLALILANGVKDERVSGESIDDMMRAAVELKDADIWLLSEIYAMQSPFMNTQQWVNKPINQKWNDLSGYWQTYWTKNQNRYAGSSGISLMGSFARLESLGMIAPGPNRSSAMSPVAQCYFLLPDGARLYEWLQEIAQGHKAATEGAK